MPTLTIEYDTLSDLRAGQGPDSYLLVNELIRAGSTCLIQRNGDKVEVLIGDVEHVVTPAASPVSKPAVRRDKRAETPFSRL